MQLIKNVALLAGIAAALPAACPAPQPQTHEKFGLIAIRSGSPVQNTGITASKSRVLIGGNQNDAVCAVKDTDYATFYIVDGAAYLYTTAGAETQQLWVDRSGMGQGVSGYTTGNQIAPRNAERTGFSIDDEDHLVFDGQSPQACPSENGAYSLWFTNAEKPGFQDGCIGVALRVIPSDTPVSCAYSCS